MKYNAYIKYYDKLNKVTYDIADSRRSRSNTLSNLVVSWCNFSATGGGGVLQSPLSQSHSKSSQKLTTTFLP